MTTDDVEDFFDLIVSNWHANSPHACSDSNADIVFSTSASRFQRNEARTRLRYLHPSAERDAYTVHLRALRPIEAARR